MQIVELAREDGKKEDAMLQVKAQLDDTILRNIDPTKRERLYEALVSELAGADEVKGLDRGWALRIISGTIFLSALAGVVILSPIYFLEPLSTAILVSNVMGILLLFAVGFNRGKGRSLPIRLVGATAAATLGLIIALITTYLGG